jgi:hypothetical protein
MNDSSKSKFYGSPAPAGDPPKLEEEEAFFSKFIRKVGN